MRHNDWRYEKLPVADDSLSSYTKEKAGYNPWITYCPGNFLYRVFYKMGQWRSGQVQFRSAGDVRFLQRTDKHSIPKKRMLFWFYKISRLGLILIHTEKPFNLFKYQQYCMFNTWFYLSFFSAINLKKKRYFLIVFAVLFLSFLLHWELNSIWKTFLWNYGS